MSDKPHTYTLVNRRLFCFQCGRQVEPDPDEPNPLKWRVLSEGDSTASHVGNNGDMHWLTNRRD